MHNSTTESTRVVCPHGEFKCTKANTICLSFPRSEGKTKRSAAGSQRQPSPLQRRGPPYLLERRGGRQGTKTRGENPKSKTKNYHTSPSAPASAALSKPKQSEIGKRK